MKKTVIIFTIIALALCSGVLVIPSQSRIVKSANLPQVQAQQAGDEYPYDVFKATLEMLIATQN